MNETTLRQIPFQLELGSGNFIHGESFYTPSSERKPVIVICHSFMAFKDWGFFPFVGSKLASAGFVVVLFNFSMNGVVRGGNRITNFTAFEKNTFTQELADLGIVINGIKSGAIAEKIVDPEKIALLGHSRGGGIAILRTSIDKRIKALVTWSAISLLDRWTDHQKAKWRTLGFLPLAMDSTVSPLRLGINLLNDLEGHREELNPILAAAKIDVPWLLIHGKADVTVPPKEAERLYNASRKTVSDIVMLDAVGHLYNAASRDEDNYQTLNHIIDITSHWLYRHI